LALTSPTSGGRSVGIFRLHTKDTEFSLYNNPYPLVFPKRSSSSEFLRLAHVSDSDIFKAITSLRPSTSIGLDDISGLIITGFSDIFVLVLKHTFNVSVSQQYFPTLWKQAALFPFSIKATAPLLAITG
jgi:hypothetical protein